MGEAADGGQGLSRVSILLDFFYFVPYPGYYITLWNRMMYDHNGNLSDLSEEDLDYAA